MTGTFTYGVEKNEEQTYVRFYFFSFFLFLLTISAGSREYNAYERHEFEICHVRLKIHYFDIWIKSGNNSSYKIFAI